MGNRKIAVYKAPKVFFRAFNDVGNLQREADGKFQRFLHPHKVAIDGLQLLNALSIALILRLGRLILLEFENINHGLGGRQHSGFSVGF